MNRRSFLKLLGLGSIALPIMGMVKKGLARGGIVKKLSVIPEPEAIIPIKPGITYCNKDNFGGYIMAKVTTPSGTITIKNGGDVLLYDPAGKRVR